MKTKIDFLKQCTFIFDKNNAPVVTMQSTELNKFLSIFGNGYLNVCIGNGIIYINLQELCNNHSIEVLSIIPYANRISKGYITSLQENEIFVFGSNESAIHGKGAAIQAVVFGASKKVFNGISGNTYAIPTKDKSIKTLPIKAIKEYVCEFVLFALKNPQLIFLVTEIGCGLAGYKVSDIAPLFFTVAKIPNVHLPLSFWNYLNDNDLI